jgi:hypothetical protein
VRGVNERFGTEFSEGNRLFAEQLIADAQTERGPGGEVFRLRRRRSDEEVTNAQRPAGEGPEMDAVETASAATLITLRTQLCFPRLVAG